MQKIFLFIIILGICSCSVLPGMQNIDASARYRNHDVPNIRVTPVIIPITQGLILKHPPPNYIYRVEPQDILSINVWRHSEFNLPAQSMSTASTLTSQSSGQSGYLVDHKGKIYFPLVGNIYVAGKTVDEIRIILTKKLRKYIVNPQLTVRVADFRSKKIYIFGEIMRPGIFPLNDQVMSITDAIALAGSFDFRAADTRHIYVIRGSYLQPRIYWLDAHTPDGLLLAERFQLQPNDIVYVSTALLTRWNRFLEQFLPTVMAVYFTQSVVGRR